MSRYMSIARDCEDVPYIIYWGNVEVGDARVYIYPSPDKESWRRALRIARELVTFNGRIIIQLGAEMHHLDVRESSPCSILRLDVSSSALEVA